MPGHKRNPRFNITGSEIDITEIHGFDNLHSPNGLIASIENRLKNLYKSEKSFMMVNGSTGGILAAIFAVCKRGDKILIARNCHKSVYNACMLLELKVTYIEPSFDYTNGFYSRIYQDEVDKIINNNPDIKAIVITSPSYEGMISNIKTDIPLIIDAAHGAHLGIGLFPAYPKGDIVISSLHKTLPVLTQGAVANIYNSKYIDKFKKYIDIFETSSPSYVIMSSVEKCLDYIDDNKKDFNEYIRNLYNFRDIELFELKLEYTDDISKIVISTANTEIDGPQLADILRKKHNIEVEMASLNYIILMTSVADDEAALKKLQNALLEIDGQILGKTTIGCIKPPVVKEEITITVDDERCETEIYDAVGKKSNEFVYAYPPDIPIIVPNEIITEDVIAYIKRLINSGVNVVSDSGLLPNKLLTKSNI